MKISKIKSNPNNPRIIKDDKFKKLVKSLTEFPEMMSKRPLVCVTDVDDKLYPLGGNMRLKALQEIGHKEIPDEWVQIADEWTEEQRREFVIKDNVGFGEWDWDDLANNWDSEQLEEWGLEIPGISEKEIESDIFFSNELDSVSNYIVLKFSKDIDFIQIQTLLGLESTYSKRANGKPWSKGLGRVVDGVDAIIKIKES
jgi:ParB-like chromosome segregation protein Spo0J